MGGRRMTFLEAVNEIESRLAALALRDRWGEELLPLEASAIVSHFHGKAWAALEDQMEHGEITPDEYCAGILDLIRIYDLYRFNRRVERKIVALFPRESA